LHRKLFVKIPYPLQGSLMSDRMNSSLYKQPQDLGEINAYRLLEGSLPFRVPKYYFGDVSNETTNFILITEQTPFADPDGRRPLAPLEVEGPYDKCMDWALRGEVSEYYYALVRAGGRMAGCYKAGKLGPRPLLDAAFENFGLRRYEDWGCRPKESSGMGPAQISGKLAVAEDFVRNVASSLFPAAVLAEESIKVWRRVLKATDAYSAEIMWWLHRNQDYVALCHPNLNVDNAYFWRDADDQLDLGIFDWGGVRANSLGFKLWYWLYCAEFDVLSKHLDGLVTCFIDSYRESGGPSLDAKELKLQVLVSSLTQAVNLLGTVPQIYRMCPAREFETISTRRDPRIVKNVEGKSTLRMFIAMMVLTCTMIREWKLDLVLEDFVESYCVATGLEPKRVD